MFASLLFLPQSFSLAALLLLGTFQATSQRGGRSLQVWRCLRSDALLPSPPFLQPKCPIRTTRCFIRTRVSPLIPLYTGLPLNTLLLFLPTGASCASPKILFGRPLALQRPRNVFCILPFSPFAIAQRLPQVLNKYIPVPGS